MDNINDIIKDIDVCRDLGKAIQALVDFFGKHPYIHVSSQFDSIQGNYNLMMDYMAKGYVDPKRPSLYNDLLKSIWRLASNVKLQQMIRENTTYHAISEKISRDNFPEDNIRQVLEDYVSSLAMLDLEPEELRDSKAQEIYSKHQSQINSIFNRVLLSQQWSDSDEEFYEDILTSPTTDSSDAQVILSAVMLAALNIFDVNKFKLLVHVYMSTTDKRLRQRALVGWFLVYPSAPKLFEQVDELLAKVTEDDKRCEEILQTQKQFFYCLNAEKVSKDIHDGIIPNLVKDNSIRFTPLNVEETDSENLEDILHPDREEKAMERIEESIRRMADMEQQGNDIYYGEFSKMKRFAFFYTLSNWFVPFDVNHPDLAKVREKFKDVDVLKKVLASGTFCDSDRYSFAFAMVTIIDQVPQEIRDMLFSDGVKIGAIVCDIDYESPTFIRRNYLQDLYRFFLLYTDKNDFVNPYQLNLKEKSPFLFASKRIGNTKLKNHVTSLCKFFHLNGYSKEEKLILSLWENDINDFDFYMLQGSYRLKSEKDNPIEWYHKAYTLCPDSKGAIRGLAESYLRAEKFDESEKYYNQLILLDPKHWQYELGLAVVKMSKNQCDEALGLLYKLDLERPNRVSVRRVLAWTLMKAGKLDQAYKQYEQLLEMDKPQGADYLNAGYCAWFQNRITDSISLFRKYIAFLSDEEKKNFFFQIQRELKTLGVSKSAEEIHLMIDLCRRDTNN